MFSQSMPLIGQTWYSWYSHFIFIFITPVVVIQNLLREGWIMNSSFPKFQVGKMTLTGLGEVFKSFGKPLLALHDLQLLIRTWMSALGLYMGSQFSSGLGQLLKRATVDLTHWASWIFIPLFTHPGFTLPSCSLLISCSQIALSVSADPKKLEMAFVINLFLTFFNLDIVYIHCRKVSCPLKIGYFYLPIPFFNLFLTCRRT